MKLNHVAIIPDGHQRFAGNKGITLAEAYVQGTARMLEVIEYCLTYKIAYLSIYGSSAFNITEWSQDRIQMIHQGGAKFCRQLRTNPKIRVHLFGNIDQIPETACRAELQELTSASGHVDSALTVHVGFNYSDRPVETSFGVPDVDLLIRTGGKQRLSGFLPMQVCEAELLFLPVLWPNFSYTNWVNATSWYYTQDRTRGE